MTKAQQKQYNGWRRWIISRFIYGTSIEQMAFERALFGPEIEETRNEIEAVLRWGYKNRYRKRKSK